MEKHLSLHLEAPQKCQDYTGGGGGNLSGEFEKPFESRSEYDFQLNYYFS